ncbi:MAG: hypothetical protein KHW90_08330, partial [Clostridiales bacterium]|nr:hypothetical protein [Clostridiales bacterium]
YGALPHRPTKGLSERLRRPFGASPFGNLRAKILRSSYNSGLIGLTASCRNILFSFVFLFVFIR